MNASGEITTEARIAATRRVLSASSISTIESANWVTKTTSASAARPPSTCTKSARASAIPRANAARTPRPSASAAGTDSPTNDSQMSPGRMNTAARNGKGMNTSTPIAYATSARRLRNGRSSTIAHAPT